MLPLPWVSISMNACRSSVDAIEWTIIPNRSTQSLAFIAGKFDRGDLAAVSTEFAIEELHGTDR